jgi:ketosteroid isomerase-like protein
MSQDAEQTIRELTERWNRGQIDEVMELVHEDVEIDATRRVLNPAHYYGHAGFRQMAREILDVWEAWAIDVDRFWWKGDRAVVEGHVTARGRGSGVEIAETHYAVWEFRDGLPMKQTIFVEPAEAFEAVGLPAPAAVRRP